MLSKKMTFSLMSLITLLAFAFITVPAMAADDFDATFSVDSISTSSDHNAQYATDIVVTLTFGAKVDPTKAVHLRSWLKISLVRKPLVAALTSCREGH